MDQLDDLEKHVNELISELSGIIKQLQSDIADTEKVVSFKQVKEIENSIERLKKQGIPVPNELKALKIKLLSEYDGHQTRVALHRKIQDSIGSLLNRKTQGKGVGKAKQEITERHILREQFWKQLLEKSKQKTKLHVNCSPNKTNWIGTSAGKPGLGLNYVIRQNEARIELYIDRGKEWEKENKAIFDNLLTDREDIEKAFGNQLEWERLEGKRACRIKYDITVGGYRDDEGKWPKIQEAMIDAMIRFEASLEPFITKLNIQNIDAIAITKKKDRKRSLSNHEIQLRISEIAKHLTENDLENLCDPNISKKLFKMNYPIFIRIPKNSNDEIKNEAVKDSNGYARWTWKNEFEKDGYIYAITTQWYDRHDVYVKEWLDKYERNKDVNRP